LVFSDNPVDLRHELVFVLEVIGRSLYK
jgi:hypothetical protein